MKKTLAICLSAMMAVPPIALPAVVAAALAASGCTLIGLATGAAVAKSHKDPDTLEGWQVLRIEKGTRVKVFLRDGSEVQGTFSGLSLDWAEYAQRYEARQKQADSVVLPSLGDAITVTSPKGKTTPGQFEGFEFASLTIHTEGSPTPVGVPLEKISAVSFTGREPLTGAQLQTLSGQGALPVRSRMAVGENLIPVEQVSRIEVPHHGNAKAIGALIGLAVDVVIIVVVSRALKCGQNCIGL